MELVRKLRLQAMIPRLRRNEEERARFPDEADETVVLSRYDEGAAPRRAGRRPPGRADGPGAPAPRLSRAAPARPALK